MNVDKLSQSAIVYEKVCVTYEKTKDETCNKKGNHTTSVWTENGSLHLNVPYANRIQYLHKFEIIIF